MDQAFNLARRLSVRNEPDMMQEDMNGSSRRMSEQACVKDLDKYYPNLPDECASFEQVKDAIQRKNSNRHAQAVAFAGMSPHEAAQAMAARDHGNLNHAQITRRLTSNKNRSLW